MILQTSFTLGALDIFSRGYTTGDLLVVVAGEQVSNSDLINPQHYSNV